MSVYYKYMSSCNFDFTKVDVAAVSDKKTDAENKYNDRELLLLEVSRALKQSYSGREQPNIYMSAEDASFVTYELPNFDAVPMRCSSVKYIRHNS